ncbi:hypothetical protein [Segatella bryantii]|nr:hypothetical protein [Segatella bryantii]
MNEIEITCATTEYGMGGQYKKVINSNLLVLGHRLHIIDNIAV